MSSRLPTQIFRLVAIDPDGRAFVLELSESSFLPLVDHPLGALLFSSAAPTSGPPRRPG